MIICSLIVMSMVVLTEPPELLAYMVKVVMVKLTVGVPKITPLELISRPSGNGGETPNSAIAPPPRVGVDGVIAMPLVKVNGLPE